MRRRLHTTMKTPRSALRTHHSRAVGVQMRKLRTSEWMAGAFLTALLIIVSVYAIAAPGHRLNMALRAAARWSFLWFCLATYGGALTILFSSSFRGLAQRGRDFGLAFAAAHLAHLGLVVWFLYHSPD